jgi:hypothetical protein
LAPEVIGLKVPPHGGVHAPPEEDIGVFGYDLGVRAEVLLAAARWRPGCCCGDGVVDGLRDRADPITPGVPFDVDPWVIEAQAVAVVAHAATAGST